MKTSRLRLQIFSYLAAFALCVGPTPLSRAMDTKALGTIFAVGGGATIAAAAMDLGPMSADCVCVSSCPASYFQKCWYIPLAAAAIVGGIIMMMSGNDTANSVDGKANEFDPEDPEAPDTPPTTLAQWPPAGLDCSGELANTVACQADGPDQIRELLNTVENKYNNGEFTGTDFNPNDLERAKRMLNNYENGNFDAVMADAGGALSDGYGMGSSGDASLADGVSGGFGSNAEDGSLFGAGASADYSGTAGNTASGISGGRVGPTTANLDNMQWNGLLDMKDPKTGRSLTIWERATRRYMGTPDGQRGFTMARLEHLRKRSQKELAKESEPKKPSNTKKVAEVKKAPPKPQAPTVISPGSLATH
jgi:hypothetical protein